MKTIEQDISDMLRLKYPGAPEHVQKFIKTNYMQGIAYVLQEVIPHAHTLPAAEKSNIEALRKEFGAWVVKEIKNLDLKEILKDPEVMEGFLKAMLRGISKDAEEQRRSNAKKGDFHA